MRPLLTGAAIAGAAVTLAHAGPAVTTWPGLRRVAFPALAGSGSPASIALTFDDGPDPMATPQFLHLLEQRGVRATFFLLGSMVRRSPGLAKQIAEAGHEIALHGYEHRCLLWRGPRDTYDDLARGLDIVREATDATLHWYRPPYGVLTGATVVAARRLGLRPVLWSAWGRDWTAHATPLSVERTVLRALRPGGTILLHDADGTGFPGAWRSTLLALPRILDHCDRRSWTVGPLAQHAAS
jgi:peptidoglycan-N-acetylglucosamine deacetylase